MRILYYILGKANKERASGVNQVIAGLAKYVIRNGFDVRVIGKAETVEVEGESIRRDGFTVEAYSKPSIQFREAINNSIAWADVVHLHGVYSPWNLWVGRICNRFQKPYVVTLHDGLAKERIKSKTNKIKKQMFHWLLQRRHLEMAAGIHTLTEEEATDAIFWFDPIYLFCIPNGIDLEDYPTPLPYASSQSEETKIGYLGRISPEKNLDALCKAVSKIRKSNKIQLKIAGPESPYLRKLLADYGDHSIKWVGPKYGVEKTAFLREIDLFVHPSFCDVFSIAAMEALAVGTPLLITRTAKASYFYDQRAFFMCEPTANGLNRGIEVALNRRLEWPKFSRRGRELIEKQLNWGVAARNLIREYEYIFKKTR